MKVVVTSGGTSVMIDDMRCITNLSRGRFGKEIALEFWRSSIRTSECDIVLLRSETAQSGDPGGGKCNFYENTFFTFDEYMERLREICLDLRPDIVVLSAAVSDYKVDKKKGKISSSGELSLKLKPLPKVISMVREWCGKETVICGFKLLVGATQEELVKRSRKQIEDNNIDLVVANDWNTIKDPDHAIYVVTKDNVETYLRTHINHADAVVSECTRKYNELKNNGWKR